MTALYNENNDYAAQWLRNLNDAGHIAPGIVDDRSIRDLQPRDLDGFTQCHFFAGIGIWSAALRAAGWPDDREIWTGSCPCQPFSGAGKRLGTADERHLWPDFFRLIRERRPATIIGEQVAGVDGRAWLDIVQTDMESEAYAFAAVDFCAASVGAPHWRQRIYWMAHAASAGRERGRPSQAGDGRDAARIELERLRHAEYMANTNSHGRNQARLDRPASRHDGAIGNGAAGDMAHAGRAGLSPRECRELPGAHGNNQGRAAQQCGGTSRGVAYPDGGNASAARLQRSGEHGQQPENCGTGNDHGRPGPVNGFWRDADWIRCTDGKWRPVEPGTFPLAHGYPQRVGQLRAYGNAIVKDQAEAFIRAVM